MALSTHVLWVEICVFQTLDQNSWNRFDVVAPSTIFIWCVNVIQPKLCEKIDVNPTGSGNWKPSLRGMWIPSHGRTVELVTCSMSKIKTSLFLFNPKVHRQNCSPTPSCSSGVGRGLLFLVHLLNAWIRHWLWPCYFMILGMERLSRSSVPEHYWAAVKWWFWLEMTSPSHLSIDENHPFILLPSDICHILARISTSET